MTPAIDGAMATGILLLTKLPVANGLKSAAAAKPNPRPPPPKKRSNLPSKKFSKEQADPACFFSRTFFESWMNSNSEKAAAQMPGSTGNLPGPRGDSPRGMEKDSNFFVQPKTDQRFLSSARLVAGRHGQVARSTQFNF